MKKENSCTFLSMTSVRKQVSGRKMSSLHYRFGFALFKTTVIKSLQSAEDNA